MDEQKNQVVQWFQTLRGRIVEEFLAIEAEFSSISPRIKRRKWDRNGGGGGESVIILGQVFEKAGINFSIVYGKMDSKEAEEVLKEKGGEEFWASGVSVVAHTQSPFVPAIHMNTRFMSTSRSWFGGGIDLTPTYRDEEEERYFHYKLREICDTSDEGYYEKFKKNCDEYFYLSHRGEARGAGGIFYDKLGSDWEKDFKFTREVGKGFLVIYPSIVRKKMRKEWGEEEKNFQLLKRGRYVEFNLIYDRGTRFGIMTKGDPDAIMMSMPPLVRWE